MTENLRESISALMDDEANELEIHRVLSGMEQNDEVRDTWKRYQIASFAMKGKLPSHMDIDISAQIAEAISEEQIEQVSQATVSPWSRFLKPITSVAVAASVAFLVVFGALQINQTQTGPGLAQQESQPSLNSLAGADVKSPDLMPVSDESLTPSQKRLRALIDTHTQQADLSRGRAFMPYAQLVSDSESKRY